jgi:hypothetical protein
MPQNDQLMSERHVLSFKPQLRLEWRTRKRQEKSYQDHHGALTLGYFLP